MIGIIIEDTLSTIPYNTLFKFFDTLINTIVYLSNMVENVVPYSPFLLETPCW